MSHSSTATDLTTATILPLQSGPADDHSDTTGANAAIVIGGIALTGVIGVSGDIDRFRVDLTAGTSYRFELGSGSNGIGYSELMLLNSSGSKITTSSGGRDVGGGKASDARISYTAPTSGTYYLDAMGRYGSTGNYSVQAIQTSSTPVIPQPDPGGLNDDHPASNSTTGIVTPNGAAVQGVLERMGDVDYFKVVLEANSAYTFLLRGNGPLTDTFLRLHAEDGRVLASDDDGAGTKHGGSRISFIAPASGAYYLDVSSDRNQSGTYSLQAQQTSTPVTPVTPLPDPVQVDDYPATAATTGFLSVNGAPTRGVLERIYDTDWLRVDLQPGVLYQFDVEGVPGNTGSTALASPGLLLNTADGRTFHHGGKEGAPRQSFVASDDGTYYVQVAALDLTSTGTYAVTARTLPDDQPSSPATTGVVQVNGRATTGRIDAPSDADYFKVQLDAGKSYTFALAGTDGTGSLADTFLRLRDSDGNELATNDDAAGSKNSNSALKFQAQASGTYYLEASGDGRLVGGYTLSAVSALTITQATPANGALNVSRTGNLVLTLDRPVQSNHGHVLLLEPGVGAWQISLDDASQVSINGRTITINPAGDLMPNTRYSLYFSDGALKDANGSVLDGLTHGSGGELSFTTVAANRAPTAANLTAEAASDLPLNGRLPTAVDADGDAIQYLLLLGGSQQGARVSIESNGHYTYEAPHGFSGSDKFLFSVSDNKGASNTYTVSLNVVPLPVVQGTPQSDALSPVAGSHRYAGLDGSDHISTGPGADVVDAGGGTDTLVLPVARSSATLLRRSDGGWTVSSAASGSDQVFELERVQFTDVATALDLSGPAGEVARVIGALYGTTKLHDAALIGRYLALADSGVRSDQLVHQVLGDPLFAALAGSRSNEDVVKQVYTNIVGNAPSANEIAHYTGLITSGQYTQDSLLWWAAGLDETAQRIDLNGLTTHGLDFLPGAGS
jgi:hypothetical protein